MALSPAALSPLVLGLALLVVACGDKDGDDSGTADGGDTDTDTDTDGGDTDTDTDGGDTDTDTDGGDTDTDTDGTTTPVVGSATLTLSGDVAGEAVALVPITDLDGGAEPILWDPVDVQAAAASVSFTLPVPDERYIETPDASNPDLQIVFYVPARFADENGNLAHDDGEAWTGVGVTWLAYVVPPVPSEFSGFLDEGWNALAVDFEGDIPFTPADIGDVPLDENLSMGDGITISGSWDAGSAPGSDTRLAMLPASIYDGPVASLLYDEPATAGTFEITLDTAPPSDHYADLDGSGRLQAGEFMMAYADDGDGAFDLEGDSPMFSACHDGDIAVFVYTDPPEDLIDGLFAVISGASIGWNAFADPEGSFRLLGETERNSLSVSESCGLL